MRRVFLFLLVTVLLCTVFSVFSEENKEEKAETESKFEKVLLKKGSLIVKEFLDCCMFEEDEYFTKYTSSDELFGFTDTLKFQSASIFDVETNIKVFALRITTGYYNSKYSYGEAVGVMDADEIDGAIQTLRYIKQNITKLRDYSEVVYKASSGMEVGAFRSSSSGTGLYVKVNSNATKFYTVEKIDSLIEAFEKVRNTFGN